jgi:hypothetical protein
MHPLHDVPDFMSFQAAFAARIRDPDGQPTPRGVNPRRMQVYEDLLFNNLDGFLRACYPVTHDMLGEQAWQGTVRRFLSEHRCQSQLFREIPSEFLTWMESRATALFPERPFLHEFMHYEWLEMIVSISPDEDASKALDPVGDLLSAVPILDCSVRLSCYQYPVHRIGPDFQPREADGQQYCFLVFRDGNDVVRFIALNPVAARMVEILAECRCSGRDVLLQVARELGRQDTSHMVEMGRTLLADLRRTGVIVGAEHLQ